MTKSSSNLLLKMKGSSARTMKTASAIRASRLARGLGWTPEISPACNSVMIISGGENIASSEVERVIYELPQVRECAVIGLADERWGEKPVAIVVLGEGAALELPALADHCRARLAGFKVPKQLIIRDSLPRNPSGKVLKRVLRAELEAS